MSTRARTAAGTSLALCLAIAAGCGDTDQVGVAVSEAHHEISTLSPSGSTAAPAELRSRVYGNVAGDLEAAARNSEGDDRGPAYLLAAEAQSGKAQVAHHAMRESLSEITHLAVRIQSNIGMLLSHDSQAGAFESYDASADRARVQKQIESLTSELADIGFERQGLESEVSGLRQQAESKAAKARETRNQAADLRNSAERLDGEARLNVITQAVQFSREADMHERGSDELNAVIEHQTPQIAFFESQRERVSQQLASARATLGSIDSSASQRREQARSARANAAGVREQLSSDTGALMQAINGRFAELYAQATSGYDTAIGTLGRAGSGGSRDESRASKGVLEHAALIVERDALGALRLAEYSLASAQEAGVDVAGLAGIRETVQSITERGADLLGRARDSLASSGVRGEAGEGLTRISEKLDAIETQFGIEPSSEESDG